MGVSGREDGQGRGGGRVGKWAGMRWEHRSGRWANGGARKVLASRMRAQCPGRGHGITHKGEVSWMRVWWARRHGRGRGKGGASSTDEGMARGTSAPRMRRAARTVGCAATHALQPAGVDVPGGCGRDNGDGGAGGAAVPHLRCVADACGGRGAGAVAQFMMHALGCMSDGKGTWG